MIIQLGDFLVSLCESTYLFLLLSIEFIESILVVMTIFLKSTFNLWTILFGLITVLLMILIYGERRCDFRCVIINPKPEGGGENKDIETKPPTLAEPTPAVT